MSTEAQLSLDHLARALSRLASADVLVEAARPLHGGACQDNILLDVRIDGAEPTRLVLRGDSPSSLPGSIGRREEFAVIQAAVDAGVRTPAARWLGQDVIRGGAWSYLLDWVPGQAIGRRIVSHPSLAAARGRLLGEVAAVLADVHRVTPETSPELPLADLERLRDVGPARVAVDFARAMIDGLGEPHPAMVLAASWLERHAPADRELVLVHGDYRTGNFMVTPDGLSAVLDWEFAHWGSPFDDLGWISVRDWRFGVLDQPVGGFGRRAAFFEAYAAASGRAVDPSVVHWWEVLGNLRWAAAAAYQGERYLSGEVPDFELIAIGRRCAEMEWEALRLIDAGPQPDVAARAGGG